MSEEGHKRWIDVAPESAFESTDRLLVDLGDEEQIGVFKVKGQWYAIGAWCSHEKRSLFEGDRNEHEIMCPEHGSLFDLRNGEALSLPAVKPVPSYTVKVEDGRVLILVDAPTS